MRLRLPPLPPPPLLQNPSYDSETGDGRTSEATLETPSNGSRANSVEVALKEVLLIYPKNSEEKRFRHFGYSSEGQY